MAATSEEGLQSLLLNFDLLHQERKNAVTEVQLLNSRCSLETQAREALEVACQSLKIDNERLRKINAEAIAKLATQLEQGTKWQRLKEKLKKTEDEYLNKEKDYEKTIVEFKQDSTMKIGELDNQISLLEERNKQLQQDIASYKSQIDLLSTEIGHVNGRVELKYYDEIQDLRGLLLVEQEEKKELARKLQSAEEELLICKRKQAEQERESTSNRHVETLKLKIMKLRKENEVLRRRQLSGCRS